MTKTFNLLACVALLLITASCTAPQSGLYLTSQVEPHNSLFKAEPSEDTLERALKNTLTGLKYQVSIEEKYTILKSVATGNEFILARNYDSTNHKVYEVSKQQDSTTIKRTILLLHQDEILYRVVIEVPSHMPKPLQTSGSISMVSMMYHPYSYGEAVAHLNLTK